MSSFLEMCYNMFYIKGIYKNSSQEGTIRIILSMYFKNLLGGYVDSDEFVPARFSLKHSKTGNTVLYAVAD